MAVRRDKYGRFRGKGGIKPYKSNLKAGKRGRKYPSASVSVTKGNKRAKVSFSKKRFAIGAAVGLGAYVAGTISVGAGPRRRY